MVNRLECYGLLSCLLLIVGDTVPLPSRTSSLLGELPSGKLELQYFLHLSEYLQYTQPHLSLSLSVHHCAVATNTSVLSPLPPSPTPSSGRLLCWVLTSPQTLWTRAKHIVNTRGPRYDTLLLMSSKLDLLFPGTVLALATEEGRANLYNKYQPVPYLDKADWFLKADDTYVIVENLRLLLSLFSPDKPVYLGRRFCRFVHQGYMSGGAGYVLSRESVSRYVRGPAPWNLHPVHLCRGPTAGLLPPEGNLPPPVYNYYPSKVGPDCCSNSFVSSHYVKPVRMYMLDYFLYHLNPVGGHSPKLGETREE
uniref:N-acetylgalactosaminide beta-1,3-galactosyltransferase n=1 Tax=Hucho hucho TaxID=62062 RepID=A0A4W5PIB1_9TELE